MPATKLDARTALIVIDLQKGIASLATDAMTDMSAEAHANSIERIFPRLGETATTREIVGILDAGRQAIRA